MKYVIVLGDGMADEPIEQLSGRTPLEAAVTPEMDRLAKMSEVGMVSTIPEGMSPGSDTANLAVLGYDPALYYTGRSPLEALSIGVDMKPTDVAVRTNIVTLSQEESEYAEKTIIDHSSGEISTEEAAELLAAVREGLAQEGYSFYVGVSYRHLLIIDGGELPELVAPHDVLGQKIGQHLPKDPTLRAMMEKSYDILSKHPVNLARMARGENPANSIWFWGPGTKPALANFEEKTGKHAAMISAVDLLKGIAVGSGMTNISVPGADGTLHTNYEGKAQAAIDAVLTGGFDMVYIHVEATDEMGHQGSVPLKIEGIEYLDSRIIAPVCKALDAVGCEYRMLVLPDHPTPCRVRTHTADPVPYLLYDSTCPISGPDTYNEKSAAATGISVNPGWQLIDHLFSK